MDNIKVYTIFSCDNDGNTNAYVIGVYSTKRLARKKILALVKDDFKGNSPNDLKRHIENDNRFENIDPENIRWRHIRDYFNGELKRNNGCSAWFRCTDYIISSYIINED